MIRLATPADIDVLADVERSAARRFLEMPGNVVDLERTLPRPALEKAKAEQALWVSETQKANIVGFLAAFHTGQGLHIEELSVAYEHQGQGYGKALLTAAFTHARQADCSYISLTTDKTIPWNMPFYRKMGFEEASLEQCPPLLADILLRDKKRVPTPDNRIAMMRSVM